MDVLSLENLSDNLKILRAMSFASEFGSSLKSFGEAHRVLFKYRLTHYLWIPGIITILYCVLFFWLTSYFAGRIASEADAYPSWLSWMGWFTHWFLKSIYWVATVFFFFASLKYILQVLLSPLLSNLSVAVEQRVLGCGMVNCHPLRNDRTTAIATSDLLKFLERVRHPPRVIELPELAAST